jgi:hypothetical protein
VNSEEFAALVLEYFERGFDPANSYRVTLDEGRKLRWTARGAGGEVEWRKEPGSSLWQRIQLRVMSWIPMEKEL